MKTASRKFLFKDPMIIAEFSGLKKLVRLGVPAFFVCTSLLASMPLDPKYPTEGIDPAWQYAMNEAVAKGMQFGSDIVFTFGPYASAYSCQYHPLTDGLMLASSALLGLGLALGALTYALPNKRLYLLPIPFLIVLLSRDSFLFLIPMVFMLLVLRVTPAINGVLSKPKGRFLKLSLALLTIDLSLLTLIKFSFGFAALAFSLFGFVLLAITYPRQTSGLITIYILALTFFWLLAKQPFSLLPGFFIAQIPMISGYSEAMSLPDDLAEIIRFLIAAVILLIVVTCYSSGRLSRKFLVGSCTFILLFLVFKSSFTRLHPLYGLDFILLASFILATAIPHSAGIFLILVSFACWIPTAINSQEILNESIAASAMRSLSLSNAVQGILFRMQDPGGCEKRFEQAKANIRRVDPLPKLEGGTDIYPTDDEVVLANNLFWNPRPIIQSYAAYNQYLAQINAKHLNTKSSPGYVFFDVMPIDYRLPALEDGLSWSILLTRYEVAGQTSRYLWLKRYPEKRSDALKKEISKNSLNLGKQFRLPQRTDPLWAEIDIQPTIFGRIMSALYKPPQLQIVFSYIDGRTESYRYIPAMGRGGFLLSPVIHDRHDFGALLMDGNTEYFANERPVSVEVVGSPNAHLCWQNTFKIRLSNITFPIQHGIEQFIYDQPVRELAVDTSSKTAECWIDKVNDRIDISQQTPTSKPIEVKGPLLAVDGWAAVSAHDGLAGEKVFVVLVDPNGTSHPVLARIYKRPDVNAYFNRPEMGNTGFEARMKTSGLKGECKLRIYVQHNDQLFAWPTIVNVRLNG